MLAVALLLLFRVVLSWLGILLGSAIKDEQMLQQVAPLIFGAVMFSNVFTPTDLMPVGVRQIAEWNPVSAVVSALRELFGNAAAAPDTVWPLAHPVAATVLWSVAILAVSIPLATRAYASSR